MNTQDTVVTISFRGDDQIVSDVVNAMTDMREDELLRLELESLGLTLKETDSDRKYIAVTNEEGALAEFILKTNDVPFVPDTAIKSTAPNEDTWYVLDADYKG